MQYIRRIWGNIRKKKGGGYSKNMPNKNKYTKKYNMGGMTMADKMAAPMDTTPQKSPIGINKGSPMGIMNKGYAHGGGIRKVKY